MTAPTLIQLGPTRTSNDESVMIDDLDDLAESTKCSCNAGDDNPY
jgi:hypothetical protein